MGKRDKSSIQTGLPKKIRVVRGRGMAKTGNITLGKQNCQYLYMKTCDEVNINCLISGLLNQYQAVKR